MVGLRLGHYKIVEKLGAGGRETFDLSGEANPEPPVPPLIPDSLYHGSRVSTVPRNPEAPRASSAVNAIVLPLGLSTPGN